MEQLGYKGTIVVYLYISFEGFIYSSMALCCEFQTLYIFHRDMFVPIDCKPKLKQMAESYLDDIFKFYDQLNVSESLVRWCCISSIKRFSYFCPIGYRPAGVNSSIST